MLTVEDEAIIAAFRRHTLLSQEGCPHALQTIIPHLTRLSVYRCCQRHDISRLPEVEGDEPKQGQFRSYPFMHFPIHIAEVRTEQGSEFIYRELDLWIT